MAICLYLKNGTPIELAAGVDVEPTYFPAPAGLDGRHALEVVDRDGNALACFQLGEVAGYVFDPPEGAERP